MKELSTKKERIFHNRNVLYFPQVLAEEGKAKAIAFDEIDKAPEEKKRGITIATVSMFFLIIILAFWYLWSSVSFNWVIDSSSQSITPT